MYKELIGNNELDTDHGHTNVLVSDYIMTLIDRRKYEEEDSTLVEALIDLVDLSYKLTKIQSFL